MVARISSGKSIRGILNYNENKVANAEARLLLAAGFPCEPAQLSFKNKLHRFEFLTKQNERATTNALHITLNFSRQDNLSDELLQQIALDYMQRIGFGEQPFLVYRHFDASHPHIHIATVNIEDGGSRIETYNIGKNQSEKARKEIELEYGLIQAEDQQKEMAYMLRPAILNKVVYGRGETKAAISSIVREVTDSYRFTSIAELNAVLQQFNVWANPGSEGSVMRNKEGLTYHLLNDLGIPVGVPIKASSIYGSPTIKKLKSKFMQNVTGRKPYGQRLKHLLDKAIESSASLEQLKEALNRQGIRILVRENPQKEVYGITFIDNATRCVFNGSDLGKSYSARAFMERLDQKAMSFDKSDSLDGIPQSIAYNGEGNQRPYPASGLAVIDVMIEIAFAETEPPIISDQIRRKKRKKKKYPQQ